jgi:hypothetical protein
MSVTALFPIEDLTENAKVMKFVPYYSSFTGTNVKAMCCNLVEFLGSYSSVPTVFNFII